MSQARDRSDPPRAIVHKRILDVAESRPDASMADIADEVAVASTELVEKVLEEYGDPGTDAGGQPPPDQAAGPEPDPEPEPDRNDPLLDGNPDAEPVADTAAADRRVADGSGDTLSPGAAPVTDDAEEADNADEAVDEAPDRPAEDDAGPELTDRQRDALRLIRDRPDASQSAIAEELGVTPGTVSRWVNDLPDFEWNRRQEIAATYLNGTMNATTTADQPNLADLQDRLETIESHLEATTAPSTALEPELVQKVMHACLHSDRITEDEELEILRTFLPAPTD